MAKTWQDLLTEARDLLQDTREPYRAEDSVYLSILNRGLKELGRLRPDAFWEFFAGDDIHIPEVVIVDADPDDDEDVFDEAEDGQIALSAAFNLPSMFYTPLVYWVTASAEIIDEEYASDGRAALLMTQFKQMVVSL